MLSKEDNELVTQTGPQTPMGEVFRRFWLPAMLWSEPLFIVLVLATVGLLIRAIAGESSARRRYDPWLARAVKKSENEHQSLALEELARTFQVGRQEMEKRLRQLDLLRGEVLGRM